MSPDIFTLLLSLKEAYLRLCVNSRQSLDASAVAVTRFTLYSECGVLCKLLSSIFPHIRRFTLNGITTRIKQPIVQAETNQQFSSSLILGLLRLRCQKKDASESHGGARGP